MANSSLTLSSLDFDTLKANFKDFLKTQTAFKDYNFEGSNMNVLLDVMSYNTYLNSFYLNMVASEMFLDSAQKYDSVVSHAKELNYVPRSAAAAVANISFTAQTASANGKFNVAKGTRFLGYAGNTNYTFVTKQSMTYLSSNNNFVVNNLQIFEGSFFQDSFVIDYEVESQRFVLSNQNIDTSTITVKVIENNGATETYYTKADTLFGVDNTSTIFFLQGCENNQYEIVFGDGYFGKRPLNLATIVVEYIVTNGEEGNGVESFSLSDDLSAINGGSVDVSAISTVSGSFNGANQENIESIRYNSPRYFATQQRAVSSDDYASLVKAKFGGQIDDVIIYGGQDLTPKQYGRVVVCVKPKGATIAPNYLKNNIQQYLLNYIALPNRVILAEPDYFYINVSSKIQYNKNQTTKFEEDIRSQVLEEMVSYGIDHLGKFGNDFRYSKFVTHIDSVDSSITSNDTRTRIVKRISPAINFATSYLIDFNNTPEREGVYGGVVYPDERVLRSSTFTYINEIGERFSGAYLEDEPIQKSPDVGNIAVYYTFKNKKILLNSSVGQIYYVANPFGFAKGPAGRVTLNDIKVDNYGNYISIYLTHAERDIIASRNMILLLEASDISTEIIETVK